MSCLEARLKAHTLDFFTASETRDTASKSPLDAAGNPASIISTPSSSSAAAIFNFSSIFIEAPGDCSPSLNVVSNILI